MARIRPYNLEPLDTIPDDAALVVDNGAIVGKATLNQLFSRAAGQVIPIEIGGTRIATITGTGVGIGSTNPETGLAVRGATPEKARVRIEGAGTNVGGSLDLLSEGSIFRIQGRKIANGGGVVFTQVGVAQRGQFDSAGNFVIGPGAANTSNSDKTHGITNRPEGRIKICSNGALMDWHRTDSDGVAVNIIRGTSSVGSITVTASSTSYNTTSDYRAKTNLEPLTGALERIRRIPVYRGNFLADPDAPKVDMFLAHEVQPEVHEAVTGDKDAVEEIGTATGYRERDPISGVPILGTLETIEGITYEECPEGYTWEKTGERPKLQGIDQSKLVPVHHAGIQELDALVSSLLDRVAALEDRVAALEAAA